MKHTLMLFASSLAVFSCTITHNWNSNNTPGHNYATFGELSGKQKFEIKLNRNAARSYIAYDIQLADGELGMTIKSPDQLLIDTSTTNRIMDTIFIDKAGNGRYNVILTGKKAAGSYDIKYGDIRVGNGDELNDKAH